MKKVSTVLLSVEVAIRYYGERRRPTLSRRKPSTLVGSVSQEGRVHKECPGSNILGANPSGANSRNGGAGRACPERARGGS